MDIPSAPGTYVNEDDVVIVLETDKVSVDVRATEAGLVTEIMGELDDVVEVGQDLYKIDTDAAAPEGGGGGKEEKKEEVAQVRMRIVRIVRIVRIRRREAERNVT